VVAGAKDGQVYAWNYDGTNLWNVAPTNFQGKTMPVVSSPVLADYNGDGYPDVFTNVYWDAAVLSGFTGRQFTSYLSQYTTSDNAAAIGDIDGDGTSELVLASADNTGTTGEVVFWHLNVPDKAPWPMFGQNARHTNLYRRSQAFDAEVVSHTIPAMMLPDQSITVSITLRNTGTEPWRASDMIHLGAVDDTDPFSSATRIALGSGEEIWPGETKTFHLTLQTPSTEGYYTTDWRMVNDVKGEWFGKTVKVRVKVGNQPALQVLTTQGIYAGGLSTTPLSGPAGFTNWPVAKVWKLTQDKRGYHMLDEYGGKWYGGETFPLFAKGFVPNLQDMVLGPDGISYYELLGDGTIYGCDADGCNRSFTPAPPKGILARSLALTTDGHGVYVVDGYGNLYTGGSAQPLSLPAGFPLNEDVIRRIKLTSDGSGYYLMDIYGRVWNGGSAPVLAPGYSPSIGEDWARDFELTENGTGYYLLDKHGAIHNGGAATPLTINVPPTSADDIGRDLALIDSRQNAAPQIRLSLDGAFLMGQAGSTDPLKTYLEVANESPVPLLWLATSQGVNGQQIFVSLSGVLQPSEATTVEIPLGDLSQHSPGTYAYDITVTATSVTTDEVVSQKATVLVYVADTIYSVYVPLVLR